MTGLAYNQYLEADGRRWNYWKASLRHYQAASDYVRYRILLGLLPAASRRVVDAGCGDGYLSYLLRRRGHRPIAVDLSASRLSKARASQPADLPVLQACCGALPLASGAVDAVIFSEILEHLESPLEALRNGARILRPGGRLILSVPHAQDAPDVVCPHCCRQFNAAGHLHRFDPEGMRALVESAGLRPLRVFTAASALTRYFLRRMTWLAPLVLPLDAALRRLAPADNLHLFVAAERPGDTR
jgi:SAM-dependent methyltransferase